jgi:hypothetical protein
MTAAKILTHNSSSQFLQEHYSFSGLISAMSSYVPALSDITVSHFNSYRQQHIIKDLKKTLRYSHKSEFTGISCLLIDFLEERFDVAVYGNSYFTLSDAFLETEAAAELTYLRLARNTPRSWRLWREKYLEFIELIRNFFAGKPVVLVKMKLAEYYGLYGKEYAFGNIAAIREQNKIIERCYEFIIPRCPDFLVVEVEHDETYFTDLNFRHGCHPWHLSQAAYAEIASRVQEKLKEYYYAAQLSK